MEQFCVIISVLMLILSGITLGTLSAIKVLQKRIVALKNELSKQPRLERESLTMVCSSCNTIGKFNFARDFDGNCVTYCKKCGHVNKQINNGTK